MLMLTSVGCVFVTAWYCSRQFWTKYAVVSSVRC